MRTALIAAATVATVSISAHPAAAAEGPLVRDYLAWHRFGL